MARDHRPDAITLDLGLPDRGGLEAIADLRAAAPEARLLVVSMHTDRALADAALHAGAAGYVPKDAGIPELESALGEVLAGRRYLSPRLPRRGPKSGIDAVQLGLGRLTPRQQEIVRLMGDGHNTAEIAERLHVSLNTVAFHRKRIRKALGIDTELGLVRYALLVQVGSGPQP
jgi:DNA-binding NarL/FixJ family response regulator